MSSRQAAALATALAAVGCLPHAGAFEIDTGDSDLRLRWDNTLKYNAAWRVKDRDSKLVSTVNQDDSDRNFNKGLISNRLNILSEFDARYNNFGTRVSAAGWYDSVYEGGNDNDSPATANQRSVRYDHFTDDTRKLHGSNAEILDAFVFGKGNVGELPTSFRLGRHTVLWGESLFFGANGIAGGQAPVDIIKATSVPNTPFKELIRPVNQFSGQVQLRPNVSVAAYYQFAWEENRIPAVGSYFSTSDVVGEGGERLIVGGPIGPNQQPLAFFHGKDIKADDKGQYGLSLRFSPEDWNTDFGLYAIRYHAKDPMVYTRANPGGPNPLTGQLGEYQLVYAEGIRAFGASFSTSVGDANVAGEVSVRRNTPLVSVSQANPTGLGDNDSHALYAVGNSLHAQLSSLYSFNSNGIWDSASLAGEVAWHRRTSITKNAAALDPNSERDAWGLRMSFTPNFFQVYPGVDLSVPLGLGYNPKGRSSVISKFNNGVGDKGGDLSIGLQLEYLQTWKAGLNYTHYIGGSDNFLDSHNANTYGQPLKDRDFIAFTVQRSF
ncbi:DUF1302 domain-containing protein [Pseudomonas sp. Bout1]|uniref:DUF1302 domain-containing protein n=1 Tax=Pseudomonas sp. Bout1 TaxID=3048600 RepID=UPI002AB52C8D|nr:DUF1302 domain-containing protein [Pseudomonas sp. Bout1]MDY7533208.1 DUF1302 domain-containing protein [Pseudomonas sp. Bout1]MEB0183773.1 DUF1302 domain-containing protein [Pseudomonas sp. Bout1]